MSRILLFILGLGFNTHCYAQSGFPKYYAFYELWNKADSCLTAQNYQEAGAYFYKAAHAEVEKGFEIPREGILYNAASSYALAGREKTALQILNKMAFDYPFKDIEALQSDSAFLSLRDQKKWNRIVDKVSANYTVWFAQENIYTARTTLDNPTDEVVFYPHRAAFTNKILNQDTLPFLSISHGNFRIFFAGNTYAAAHLPEIKEQIAFAFSNALQILNVEKYNRGITLILFESVEEMQAFTGVRAQGGIAYAEFDAGLFPITATRRPQFKHEIFHIISLNAWGPSGCRLLIEGSAVYADNECHIENPIPTINAYYLQSNQLQSLDNLVNHFDEIAVQNDVMAYLQSAGVFKYLYEQYGLEKMKLLWTGGFEDFDAIYGFPVEKLEAEWIDFLKSVPIPHDFDIHKLEEGCG
ncbi:MAG TPA: hypothetical protein PLR30_02710 [Saprospiraceae bacterium]|nr:hypothetical protein [Saprospiraceae bacterium]